DPLGAALREFREETGVAPEGELIELGEVRQPGGKLVRAWAVEGNFDAARLRSNMFSLEWPPRTGKLLQFPEVDRGEWFSIETARVKLLKGQLGLVDRLVLRLRESLEFC